MGSRIWNDTIFSVSPCLPLPSAIITSSQDESLYCEEWFTLIGMVIKNLEWLCTLDSYTIEILGFTPSGFSPTRLFLVFPSDGLSRPFGVAVGLPTYPSLICHWA
ncbi:hypothetical protein EYF80_031890 [Liparis tanakae]|uniref:Uncharacterized protein n=1 Tax=Liparis tanakae TaxID=230148 RepID=A0A4Z2GX56_9TELE|nr:hypothetical protein EYF80_031890 [Liparis tanakae]